jgi:hypothetical protein
MLRNALLWLVGAQGSTRPASLLRVALVLLAWSAYAAEVRPSVDPSMDRQIYGALFFVLSTLSFFGVWSRLSTGALGLLLVTMYYSGSYEPWTHHHRYLLNAAILLLGFAPCGGSYSVDRWLAVRRARREGVEPPPERGDLWAMRLIALQLAAVYFWGAWDKTQWAFLSGERMEHHLMGLYWGSDPLPRAVEVLLAMTAWIVVVVEYALPVGLFVPRFRGWFIATGVVLHALFYVLIPVGTFSLTCWALYLCFVDPDAVHRFIDDLGSPTPSPEPA